MITRRAFVAQVVSAAAPANERLIIDTHLEVWTLDPKFPFAHPERPNLKVSETAPIENQVEQMRDFNIRLAVLNQTRATSAGQLLHQPQPAPPSKSVRRRYINLLVSRYDPSQDCGYGYHRRQRLG